MKSLEDFELGRDMIDLQRGAVVTTLSGREPEGTAVGVVPAGHQWAVPRSLGQWHRCRRRSGTRDSEARHFLQRERLFFEMDFACFFIPGLVRASSEELCKPLSDSCSD